MCRLILRAVVLLNTPDMPCCKSNLRCVWQRNCSPFAGRRTVAKNNANDQDDNNTHEKVAPDRSRSKLPLASSVHCQPRSLSPHNRPCRRRDCERRPLTCSSSCQVQGDFQHHLFTRPDGMVQCLCLQKVSAACERIATDAQCICTQPVAWAR
jgi:hypothetical protein